jgi:hypothetical protein
MIKNDAERGGYLPPLVIIFESSSKELMILKGFKGSRV